MDDLLPQLLEAWRTNNRINLLLIDHIDDEGMKCTLSKRGGRNVVRQFAHLHNARQWHLEARAGDLGKGLATFATHDEPAKDELKAAPAHPQAVRPQDRRAGRLGHLGLGEALKGPPR